MSRPLILSLAALSLFLVLFPLTLAKPGMPPVLKSDEPAYYLMALSLVRDGDLAFTQEDSDRVFEEFAYRKVDNVILMTEDGWQTAHYSKPYLYSFFAAPLAALFGANGMIAFNMLLLVGLIWMGTAYLSRFNEPWLAALFATGFFVLSNGFAYVFWIHPELFCMAAVGVAYFLVFTTHDEIPRGRFSWRAPVSGAALALTVYHKPMIVALGLGLLVRELRRRGWRSAVAWGVGLALGLGAAAGLATLLTGQPSPYLGAERQGVTICEPGVMPFEPDPPGTSEARSRSPTAGTWSWILRVPTLPFADLLEHLAYFLWGRHAGLLPYMPFAVLALLLWVAHGRRSIARWCTAGSLALVALAFILTVSHNWQGGGGFIGNRYYVLVYPAFLFLATRIQPSWLIAPAFAVGGLLLGSIVFTPFGASVPEPTLQAHVRNFPYPLLPREVALREIPGYQHTLSGGRRFEGRNDQFLPTGEEMWVAAGETAEVLIVGQQPLTEMAFLVRSPAPKNRVELAVGGAEAVVEFEPDGPRIQRVVLSPDAPGGQRNVRGVRQHLDRLSVRAEQARVQHWTRRYPPDPCEYFAYNESREESFPLGAALLYLGTTESLARDVYAVEWTSVQLPEVWYAGEEAPLPVGVRNASGEAWESTGVARVKLSYHWRNLDGEPVVWNGKRTELPEPLASGVRTDLEMKVLAPAEPGRYVLELDPLFEHVSWFAERTGGATRRMEVEVLPAPSEGEGGDDLGASP